MSNVPSFAITPRAYAALHEMRETCNVDEPVFSFCIVRDETDTLRRIAQMYATGSSLDSLALLAKESIRDTMPLRGNLLIDIVSSKATGDHPQTTIGDLQFAIGDMTAIFAIADSTLDLVEKKFVFLSSEGTQIFPKSES